MTNASQGRHPSRLELAVWLAGEASPAQDVALSQHVQQCSSCGAALEQLRQHQIEHQRREPAQVVRPRERAGIAAEGAGWHRFVVGFAAIRLAASLCVLVIIGVVVLAIASC